MYEFAVSGLDKDALLELDNLEDVSDDDEQQLEEQPPLQEPKEPYEHPQTAGVDLSGELMAKIRDIFCVYFEGCHDSQLVKEDKASKWSRLLMFNGTMPWLNDYIKQNISSALLKNVLLFTQRCLRGTSQVFFQNSPLVAFSLWRQCLFSQPELPSTASLP